LCLIGGTIFWKQMENLKLQTVHRIQKCKYDGKDEWILCRSDSSSKSVPQNDRRGVILFFDWSLLNPACQLQRRSENELQKLADRFFEIGTPTGFFNREIQSSFWEKMLPYTGRIINRLFLKFGITRKRPHERADRRKCFRLQYFSCLENSKCFRCYRWSQL
jgi:hypothetical protein